MKLVNLLTGNVEPLQEFMVTSGTLTGFTIIVKSISEPDANNSNGSLLYNLGNGQGAGKLDPRCVDCYWFEDDSLLASISYDNEKSFRRTLEEIFLKLTDDRREVRSVIIGQKEWAKLQDFCIFNALEDSEKGITEPTYNGFKIRPMPYDTLLIIEHAEAQDGDDIS